MNNNKEFATAFFEVWEKASHLQAQALVDLIRRLLSEEDFAEFCEANSISVEYVTEPDDDMPHSKLN